MNNKVIYTAIFGGKDDLKEPKMIPLGWDFVCFTDSNPVSGTWHTIQSKPESDDPVRSAKIFKVLPHRFLPQYEYSVWIDGNMVVRGNPDALIEEYLAGVNIAVYDHAWTKDDSRNSVRAELSALLAMAEKGKYKDDPVLMRKQVEAYLQEGFPDNIGLISGMVIVRRHNQSDVVAAMNDWWQEIERYSRRDQLSFNYVAWKDHLDFKYIEEDSRNNHYFQWVPHKK